MKTIRYSAVAAVSLVLVVSTFFALSCNSKVQPKPQPQPKRARKTDRAHAYAGLPIGERDITILRNIGYVAGYSDSRRNPLWIAYRLSAVAAAATHPRPARFRTDTRTAALVTHDDYTNSGYDRGHMAPNRAIDICYGRDAQRETFFLSNCCPQLPALNRGAWKRLESIVAGDWMEKFEELWIICGPIFDEKRERLESGIEIPDAFYKIILDEVGGAPRVLAFIFKRAPLPGAELDAFLTTVDEIEALTGLDFLTGLEDGIEEEVEAVRANRVW